MSTKSGPSELEGIVRLFLDLDGTLIDPEVGIGQSIRYALGELNQPIPDEAALQRWIGPPLRASFAQHVGEQLADRALALYRKRYADTGWKECTVYPGIPEMLEALVAGGLSLAIATSKPHVYASRIATHFKFDRSISNVFGSELDGTRSDKRELLAFALARTGSACAAMVGDRRYDIAGARHNDIPAIGVDWGFAEKNELFEAGATAVVTSGPELVSLLLGTRHKP